MMRIVSLLSLLWSLVEVHCQTAPYVTFMSQTLDNNSYININAVGRPDVNSGEGVQCITDLSTCCSDAQGGHRGDWYFPDGTRLPNPADDVDTFQSRGDQRVELRRTSGANPPTGICRCDISTNAVHDDTDKSVRDSPIYVGLYPPSGGMCKVAIVTR